jgi:hypothetical protein
MDRQTDGRINIQTYCWTAGLTDRWKDKQTDILLDRWTDREAFSGQIDGTDRWKDKETDILLYSWTERWKDRQTDRQTYRL